MFDDVLVPIDDGDAAAAALDHALDLAAGVGATLHVLSVADSSELSYVTVGSEVRDAQERAARDLVDDALDRAATRDVTLRDRVIQGEPAETIAAYAAESVDLVVMGAHGRRGLGEHLLGSTTEQVVAACEVPVMTVRADARTDYPYRGVLIPVDGSEHARAAVAHGAGVAAESGGELTLLYVADADDSVAGDDDGAGRTETDYGRNLLDRAADVAADAGVADVQTTIRTGVDWREIHDAADAVDLIAMGAQGRTGLERYLLGSATDRVVRTASVPVLTAHGDEA